MMKKALAILLLSILSCHLGWTQKDSTIVIKIPVVQNLDSIKSIERMVFRAVEENGQIKKGDTVFINLLSNYKDKIKSWILLRKGFLEKRKIIYNPNGQLMALYTGPWDKVGYRVKENRYYNDRNQLVKLVENHLTLNDSLVWVWEYDSIGQPKSRRLIKRALEGVREDILPIISDNIGGCDYSNEDNICYDINNIGFFKEAYGLTPRAEKIRSKSMLVDEQSWFGRQKLICTHNDKGDLVSIVRFKGDKKTLDTKMEYSYNDRGDWTQIIFMDNLKNEPLYIEERIIEYY